MMSWILALTEFLNTATLQKVMALLLVIVGLALFGVIPWPIAQIDAKLQEHINQFASIRKDSEDHNRITRRFSDLLEVQAEIQERMCVNVAKTAAEQVLCTSPRARLMPRLLSSP